MPGWEDDRVRLRLLDQYVTLLRTVRQAGLPLEVDVAPRLAGDLAGTKRVLDAVLDPADRVTVMAYRDHAEAPTASSSSPGPPRGLLSARRRLPIGVETQPAEQAAVRDDVRREGRLALDREAAVVSIT